MRPCREAVRSAADVSGGAGEPLAGLPDARKPLIQLKVERVRCWRSKLINSPRQIITVITAEPP